MMGSRRAAHKIAYAHAQERLAEPQYRIAGKRIYTAEDVQRVAKQTFTPENRTVAVTFQPPEPPSEQQGPAGGPR